MRNVFVYQITVNDVVEMAVIQALEYLAHVMAGHCFAVNEACSGALDDLVT